MEKVGLRGTIWSAYVKDPALYILDEPLQGLDEPHRRQVKALIDRYCGVAGDDFILDITDERRVHGLECFVLRKIETR